MNITTLLLVVTVFSSLAIIVLALMQTSRGDMGSAFGGGGSQSMFGARGSANFLSRTTSVMVTVFFISSIALAYSYAQRAQDNSLVESDSVLEQSVNQTLEANGASSEVPGNDSNLPEIPGLESSLPSLDDPLEGQTTPDVEAATIEESE